MGAYSAWGQIQSFSRICQQSVVDLQQTLFAKVDVTPEELKWKAIQLRLNRRNTSGRIFIITWKYVHVLMLSTSSSHSAAIKHDIERLMNSDKNRIGGAKILGAKGFVLAPVRVLSQEHKLGPEHTVQIGHK
jgi:hypothetical protein